MDPTIISTRENTDTDTEAGQVQSHNIYLVGGGGPKTHRYWDGWRSKPQYHSQHGQTAPTINRQPQRTARKTKSMMQEVKKTQTRTARGWGRGKQNNNWKQRGGQTWERERPTSWATWSNNNPVGKKRKWTDMKWQLKNLRIKNFNSCNSPLQLPYSSMDSITRQQRHCKNQRSSKLFTKNKVHAVLNCTRRRFCNSKSSPDDKNEERKVVNVVCCLGD